MAGCGCQAGRGYARATVAGCGYQAGRDYARHTRDRSTAASSAHGELARRQVDRRRHGQVTMKAQVL
jgi:hypothetical protein